MTIATTISSDAVRLGNSVNNNNVAFGTVVSGNKESEFVFCNFNAVTATTLYQGQTVIIDEEFNCFLLGATTAATTTDLGTKLGTVFLGGQLGNDGNTYNDTWSVAVPAGTSQGVFVQVRGVSAAYIGAIAAANTYYNYTSGAAGYVTQEAAPAHGTQVTGIAVKAVHTTLASTVINANNTLTLPASVVGLRVGALVSGTGIANGTYVSTLSGATVSLGNNLGATPVATAGTQTATFDSNKFWVKSVASGATVLSVPPGPLATFPGATLTDSQSGTATVNTIDGNASKGWTVGLSQALTANASPNVLISTGVYEVALTYPTVLQNS